MNFRSLNRVKSVRNNILNNLQISLEYIMVTREKGCISVNPYVSPSSVFLLVLPSCVCSGWSGLLIYSDMQSNQWTWCCMSDPHQKVVVFCKAYFSFRPAAEMSNRSVQISTKSQGQAAVFQAWSISIISTFISPERFLIFCQRDYSGR